MPGALKRGLTGLREENRMKRLLMILPIAAGIAILYSSIKLSIALVRDEPSYWWLGIVVVLIGAMVSAGLYFEVRRRVYPEEAEIPAAPAKKKRK
jgi:Na+/melibiose symporter-like transporter